MTQPPPGSGYLWALVVVLGIGTFVLRLSFIQLYTWVDEFPPRVERALRYIPVAVLAALVTPALFPLDGSLVRTVLNARALAGAVATVVAWRTNSITATIAVGMATLWGIQFLVG